VLIAMKSMPHKDIILGGMAFLDKIKDSIDIIDFTQHKYFSSIYEFASTNKKINEISMRLTC
jgi:hypothetical protein